MPFHLDKARPDEAAEIAYITVTAMDDHSQRLKYGSAKLEDVIPIFTEFTHLDLAGAPDAAPYFVARDEELGGKIISYAQWVFPEDPEDESKLKNPNDSLPSNKISVPEDWNVAWLHEFGKQIAAMREKTLQGRPAYILRNMSTHPDHERRGAGSMLISWPMEQADKDGVPLYVDTFLGGPGESCYRKLGFETVESHEFDLEQFGGHGKSTYITMLRYPKKQ